MCLCPHRKVVNFTFRKLETFATCLYNMGRYTVPEVHCPIELVLIIYITILLRFIFFVYFIETGFIQFLFPNFIQ